MVFYFSATGNSKYVARLAGKEFDCQVIDISVAMKMETYSYEAKKGEKIIFVFPVNFCGLPAPVAAFINNLQLTGEDLEISAIATYGNAAGGVDRSFRKIIKEKGWTVMGFYRVKMVENYIFYLSIPLPEEQIMLLRRSDDEIRDAIDAIKFNYRKSIKTSIFTGAYSKLMYSFFRGYGSTKKFYVEKKCVGCGLCQTVCPSDAIRMDEGVPHWVKDKCFHCTACINRCPAEAIQYGKGTAKKRRYVNPNV